MLGVDESLAEIEHLHGERVVFHPHPDHGLPHARVACDIGQGLLHDPVGAGFDLGRETPPLQPAVFQLHPDARLAREAVREADHGREQAEVVQHRGPQVERQVAHPSEQIAQEPLGLVQSRPCGRRWDTLERVETQLDAGELLADFVVELACEMPPFEFLHLDQALRQCRQPLACGFDLLEEVFAFDRQRHRVGNLPDERHLYGGRPALAAPQQAEHAGHRVPALQRHREKRKKVRGYGEARRSEIPNRLEIRDQICFPGEHAFRRPYVPQANVRTGTGQRVARPKGAERQPLTRRVEFREAGEVTAGEFL